MYILADITSVGMLFYGILVLCIGAILTVVYHFREKKEARELLVLSEIAKADDFNATKNGDELLQYMKKTYLTRYWNTPNSYTISAQSEFFSFLTKLSSMVEQVGLVGRKIVFPNFERISFNDTRSYIGLSVTAEGQTIYLHLQCEFMDPDRFINGENFARNEFFAFPIEDGDNYVLVIREIIVMAPPPEKTVLKRKALVICRDATTLRTKPYLPEREEVQILKIKEGRFGPEARPMSIPVSEKKFELDDLYENTNIEFRGKTHNLTMTTMLHIIVSFLTRGGNVLFHGPNGTGKSQLIKFICYNINKLIPNSEGRYQILVVSPQDIEHLEPVMDNLDGGKTLVVIDEADPLISGTKDRGMSTLSQLMSGPLKDHYKTSFLLSTNLTLDELHPTIATKHRIGWKVEFPPLGKEKAKELGEKIKEGLEPEELFDAEEFAKLLEKESKASLSDIFSLVRPKVFQEAIDNVLQDFLIPEDISVKPETENVAEEKTRENLDKKTLEELENRYPDGPVEEKRPKEAQPGKKKLKVKKPANFPKL